jgi:7-cyano-7-deazaguanine reductase
MLKELDNSNINVHLGKSSQYKSTYDPSLLVREPRASNRKHIDIQDDNLPFVGYDIWNAYEFSCLCAHGAPLTGIAKVVYPASSKYIVESKSIKLYFNSFNMQKFEGTVEQILNEVEQTIQKDLSELLETTVHVHISLCSNQSEESYPPEFLYNANYKTLEEMVDITKIICTIYKETPDLLACQTLHTPEAFLYHSSLLKSNCRVTSQPDWGDVFIYMKGSTEVVPVSLLKYIVSFRDECHFHEEICETIYKRLWDLAKPDELAVTCLYVRRGGIDINPTRASHQKLLDSNLINPTMQFVKTDRQ